MLENSWLAQLGDEDLAFIKRFVLASGSLKETARIYGVSYPTVRLRLDRLIARIQIHDDHTISTQFERVIRAKAAEGVIDVQTMKTLLAAHRKDLEGPDGKAPDAD